MTGRVDGAVDAVGLLDVHVPNTPWDCHRTANQARGGFGGQWGGSPMAVPWSVWVWDIELRIQTSGAGNQFYILPHEHGPDFLGGVSAW